MVERKESELLPHSNSFGMNTKTDTAGCRSCYRIYIVGGRTAFWHGGGWPCAGKFFGQVL